MDADGDGYRRHPGAPRAGHPRRGRGLDDLRLRRHHDHGERDRSTQGWQAQLVAAGTYQFVNKYSGLCLSMPAVSTGPATQVTCTGGADQRFTLTQRAVIQLLSFVCTDVGGTGANRSVRTPGRRLRGRPVHDQREAVQQRNLDADRHHAGTTLAFASPVGAPFTSGTGTFNVQILNADGDQIGTDDITVSRQFIFAGYYYARC